MFQVGVAYHIPFHVLIHREAILTVQKRQWGPACLEADTELRSTSFHRIMDNIIPCITHFRTLSYL